MAQRLLKPHSMKIGNGIHKEGVIKEVVARKLSYTEAARQLGVTPRTVHNYYHRFLDHGLEGLKDRRKGNYRKLSLDEEATIVQYKLERPQRSARLIRDRLGLKVSEEAVRLVLVKHRLNRKALESESNGNRIYRETL